MPPAKAIKDAVAAHRGIPALSKQKSANRAPLGKEFEGLTVPMIVDRVLAAPTAGASCEPMCMALLALREKVQVDPTCIAKVGGKLAERSSAWSAFLSRVINDEQNRVRRATMATISWLMVQLAPMAASDPSYQLFILNQRFLQLLTHEAPIVEIAQTILHCCQSQQVIETVVKNHEMPNILRGAIERLAHSGPQYLDSLTALVMLGANLVGRHPGVAGDMVDAHIDELLCQVGLRNINNLGTQMGAVTQRAVLYCLRFFVRIRRENVAFCESCFSMCAHSIQALPNEATDLCGDVCAVMTNPNAVARSHPNIFLNVVTLATRMPNMSRAHFVFRLLKGLLPATETNLQAGYAEYGFAAAMKLCKIGWLDPDPPPDPSLYRKEAVSELLDLLVVCIQFGQRETLSRRINSSVLAALRDHVVAKVKEHRSFLVKFTQLQMYFSLPAPVTGLCKFWLRLTPFIESKDLSIGDYNASHPLVVPYDPLVTVPAEHRMQNYLNMVRHQLGEFESKETTARMQTKDQYVQDLNRLLDVITSERVEILHSKNELEFRLVDSAARTRLADMRLIVDEEHQRFRAERMLEMNYAKQQIMARHETILRVAADLAKAELDDAQLPPHEMADMRLYHRKAIDRIKKGLRIDRDTQIAEIRWHASQGNFLRHLLRDYNDANAQHNAIAHLQMQEEIVRGCGWYHLVRYRAEDEGETVSIAAATNSMAGVLRNVMYGASHQSTGSAAAVGSMGYNGGDDSASSNDMLSRSEFFNGVQTMPNLPVGTPETYVSITEEEEGAWQLLRNEIDHTISRTRRQSLQREDATDALEYGEEIERFVIHEESWRAYMLMRGELEHAEIFEQWRSGVPLTVEELEHRNRFTIEDKALRWLAATSGIVSVQVEEETRRDFIKTTIYNIKSWMERFELLGRTAIEVDECRHIHMLLVQLKEPQMREMIARAEAMEREIFDEAISAGVGIPIELLFCDSSLEPEICEDLDPFLWPSIAKEIPWHRSSFHNNSLLPDRVRRNNSSRSISLVSDSFRASATAAAAAVLREDVMETRPEIRDSRDKKKK